MNLFGLTGGNFHIERTLTFPDFPDSLIEFSGDSKSFCDGEEWDGEFEAEGTYDGPTDVIGLEGYTLVWTTDGRLLFEDGSIDLLISDGTVVRELWTSIYEVTEGELGEMPEGGQTATATFTDFKVDGDTLSYHWEGEVVATKP
jgi:hypothetical protein